MYDSLSLICLVREGTETYGNIIISKYSSLTFFYLYFLYVYPCILMRGNNMFAGSSQGGSDKATLGKLPVDILILLLLVEVVGVVVVVVVVVLLLLPLLIF